MAAAIGAALLIALVAAFLSVFRVGLLPPKIEKRSLSLGAATAHAVVGPKLERGDLTDIDALLESYQIDTRVDWAALVADVTASGKIVDRIAARIGVDPAEIAADTQVTASVPDALTEPNFADRAAQISAAGSSYRLDIQANPTLPVIDFYALGPTAADAGRLADKAVAASNAYLRGLAGLRGEGTGDYAGVRLTRLGSPVATTLSPKAPVQIAALTFVVVLGICLGALVLARILRRGWRAWDRGTQTPERPPEPADEALDDAWPRTGRLLPWMLAAFMALLWLVPFNGVDIDVSLPVDLKLDRIVLPAIVLLWLLALAAGGRGAPSRRVTAIHAAIAVFAAVAFLSVILNAETLSRGLDLDLAIKKLTLLVAYASVFAVVASAIRRNELRAFLKLNLALAVVCSIGVIWEYRYGYNVFYDIAANALPPIFDVQVAPSGFDELGRRAVSGPTDHSLELVAILSMALPIALVGLMRARHLRDQIVYVLAAVIIGAAIISTYRKSALLAPVAGVATILFLARGQARRLAPLAVIALILLPLTSFSAFGSIVSQLDSDELGVSTVNDRVADYDAVRPDILSNPVLGRGFGSYEHSHSPGQARILDSDLLLRTVETGLVGIVAFLAMICTVIAVARSEIRSRGPDGAPVAIAAAAAAAAFLALTALFDEWSFPHAPYVFMVLAGLLAVATRAPAGEAEEPARKAAIRRPRTAADREKRVPAHVPIQDVRHRGNSPAGGKLGRSGATASDVYPA